MNNKSILLPIGSVTRKERELYAYLVASVFQREVQPTLYAMTLFIRLDCDAVMRLLSGLQHFGLIKYSTEGGMRVEITGCGSQIAFMGEVQ